MHIRRLGAMGEMYMCLFEPASDAVPLLYVLSAPPSEMLDTLEYM